jgi:hypothetical protein
MRTILLTLLTLCLATMPWTARAQPAGDAVSAGSPWDPVQMGQTIDAARQARKQGDVMTAERLCYSAFQGVDQSALAAYDAYADRLHAEHRAEEATVRDQSARLHALKAEQSKGTQPTSTYLGFAPTEGLKAYADLLATLQQPEESERMRSLALAYQQVQQAHFQRTMMFRQGQDPRGAC